MVHSYFPLASNQCAPLHEDDFVRLLCYLFRGNICSSGYLRDLSAWLGCDPSLKLLLPLRRRMSGKGLLEKDLSRLFLRVKFSLIYIVDLFLGQWFFILVFAGDAEFAPRFSGIDDASTGVETDGQMPGIASCGLQSDVSEVVYSRSRSWELREQAFNDGIFMSKWGVYRYCSSLVPDFTSFLPFRLIRHRILLPLLCMPLGIRLFVFVAPSVW